MTTYLYNGAFTVDIIGDESFLQKLENRFTQKLRAELGAL